MTSWSEDELSTIARTDELRISSDTRDGTSTKPVIIWVVRVADDVFVRSVKGTAGGWFGATRATGRGHIQIGGLERDVAFTAVGDPDLHAEISSAFREKYSRYPAFTVDAVVTEDAVAATLQLTPR